MSENSPKKQSKKKGIPIRVMCYMAVFIALSAVTNIYTFMIGVGGSTALSLTYIPNFFAGALLGPFAGFFTGLLGDLIGCWIAPKGDINPIILLASGLMGLIPGIVFKVIKKSSSGWKYFAAVISLILIFLICSTLNTIGLYLFYFKGVGKTLWALFVSRTPKQASIWGINSAIIILLLLPMQKLIKLH